jgi:uncharacterized membrane protein
MHYFIRKFSRGTFTLGRLEAFSDGVFAIVVTLLVLDLKVPELAHHSSAAELCAALKAQLPRFLSWLISFIIVCKFWLNHHHIMNQARSANYALIWINSLFLMFQSLIPFPTALMGEYADNALAVSMFGVVMALNTVLFISLHTYILKHLLKAEYVEQQVPHIIRKSFIGVFFYLLGSAAAWVYIPAAFGLYIVTPFFFIVPPMKRT